MRPASTFFVKMWPAYETEFETPDLKQACQTQNDVRAAQLVFIAEKMLTESNKKYLRLFLQSVSPI